MASTVIEQTAVTKMGPNLYESKCFPAAMGNSLPIGYGGCALGVALQAATQSVGSSYNLYSAMGFYLVPARTDRNLICKVYPIRDTKTFATRRMEVFQKVDNEEQHCLTVTADFHIKESAMLTFSCKPTRKYSNWDQSPSVGQVRERLVNEGNLHPKLAKAHAILFSMMERYFENHLCPEGISAQNLTGIAKKVPTTQDHLDIASKASAEWLKSRHSIESKSDQYGALGFNLDGGLSFVPLSHNHQFLEDAGTCSSLDFALRIMDPNLDLNQWHLRERIAISGDAGRTYSEGKLYNADGVLVASMTQQSILRLPKKQKAAL